MGQSIPAELKHFLAGKESSLRVFKSGPASQGLVARSLLDADQSCVVVVPGSAELKETHSLLQLFSEDSKSTAVDVPVWKRQWIEFPSYLPKVPTAADWGARWAALYALAYGKRPQGVLMTVDNLLPLWPAPHIIEKNSLTLTRGEDMSPEMVLEQAVEWGYIRRGHASEIGEMVMRGDLLDIYLPGYSMPVRLEFFGDTLDEIRLFDPATQRSKAELDEVVLLPVAPALVNEELIEDGKERWKKLRTSGEITRGSEQWLGERMDNHEGFIWPGMYYKDAGTLEASLPDDAVFVLSSGEQLRARLEDRQYGWKEFIVRHLEDTGHRWPQSSLIRPAESARGIWADKRQVVFEELTIGTERNGIDLPEQQYSAFTDIFWRPEQLRRPWTALVDELKKWNRDKSQTVLSFRTERSRKKFLNLALEDGLSPAVEYNPDNAGLFALVSPLKKGMEVPWRNMRILGEDVLQPDTGRNRPKNDGKPFQGLDKHEDLVPEDLLVHKDYGLARFGGLHHLKMGDVDNDYLLLYFSGDDKLYLSVDRINLVQRFKGPEGTAPVLDKLGGTRWRKTTERARKAIEKIARDLVEMYAFRQITKGYSYGEVDDMYREFESTFGFEETPDQAKAIRDVFKDMESSTPMDRLVCGDVGFGKTEVALRAAFRCVSEGMQVVLLCPTTVLAEQHYQTFVRRMESFPVRVEMLSRFVPKKRQKTILAEAAEGNVDILIGTHRLFSKDVILPKLGLLILDEEQRFGVKHKERLKKMRQNVDALALSATPIPRTLQLSLSGIRGLSLIETPPQDRKPVETAIIEREDEMLKAVLEREIGRGGQVFWVYNRIEGLEKRVEYIKKLYPEARVAMAHGQMSEKMLEEAVHNFWHKEVDVLVSTAIVESGLDFPNANTLVVDQAQLFGLGQLYQLRGRVGRSERQAYAYFIVPSVDDLADVARKRLRIILDMDYLGAGFRVAMEDLRLRGAGNILGEVQSGQIAKVGLDLFLEMLEEEVQKLRGEESRKLSEPEVNFVFRAHLPDEYIEDAKERLRYYRMLSEAQEEKDFTELRSEMRDRFGTVPDTVLNLFGVLALKKLMARLQVSKADLYPGRGIFEWGQEADVINPAALIQWVADKGDGARLLPPGRLEIRYDSKLSVVDGLQFLGEELDSLLQICEESFKE
ncbi:MAG: transcription-repair coupling factor [Desulfovibrio sp.]